MDPCTTNTNINNARARIRSELGVPKAYAKNFSRKQICDAFKRCKAAKTFPPMSIDIFDGYIYLIDSESPLRAKHYHIVFEKGTKDEVVSVAKKLGLVELEVSKKELIANITKALEDMNIKEPIKAMKLPKGVNGPNSLGNGNLPLNIPNNMGNGNLPMNLGNAPNLGNNLPNLGNNRPMNLPNLGKNRPMNLPNLGKVNKPGKGLPNGNMNKNMPGMARFSKENEGTAGFKPGKPKPRGVPAGINSTGSRITPTGSFGFDTSNKKGLLKRLNKIKEEIGGVMYTNNSRARTLNQKPTPSKQPTGSASTIQHFYMGAPGSQMSGFPPGPASQMSGFPQFPPGPGSQMSSAGSS